MADPKLIVELVEELYELKGYLTALMVCYPETEKKVRPPLDVINRLLESEGG